MNASRTLRRLVWPVIILAVAAGCPLRKPPQPENKVFQKLSLDEALKRAKDDDKLVMIDFYTDWCGYCKELDATTWRDPRVLAWLDSHAVAIKIDAEAKASVANKYRVGSYPTIVFLRPDGSEVNRIVGYDDADEFLKDGAEVLKHK